MTISERAYTHKAAFPINEIYSGIYQHIPEMNPATIQDQLLLPDEAEISIIHGEQQGRWLPTSVAIIAQDKKGNSVDFLYVRADIDTQRALIPRNFRAWLKPLQNHHGIQYRQNPFNLSEALLVGWKKMRPQEKLSLFSRGCFERISISKTMKRLLDMKLAHLHHYLDTSDEILSQLFVWAK